MATYAIGDIQGCLGPLECLLNEVQFDPASDQLWFAGDLVNRGPQSLETLRLVKSLGTSAVVVLGNHDLHLLAVASGARTPHRKDTIDDILKAPDRDELLDWLLNRELIHYDAGLDALIVHAGLPHIWSTAQAIELAGEVTTVLRGPSSADFFQHMYGNFPDRWDHSLRGYERLRVITNYLTRMRICTADGTLDLKYKLGVENLPAGYQPWFSHEQRRNESTRILFGHWAALNGQCKLNRVIALDTGCVWGGKLTLYRLEDQQFFHCDCSPA